MDRRDFLITSLAAALPAASAAARFNAPFGTLREAAAAIRSKKISSVELTTETWRRIDQYNPKLNAIIWPLRESSLDEAKAADAAIARKQAVSAVHGVPMTIKESFHIAGTPTTWGVPKAKDWRAKTDALAVERLRKAGAVLLGKTNVPLMLLDQQSFNEIYGTTNNPWNLDYTPGGSTGGGAASLAAGLGFATLGSDIGGSIRVPAHFCGIYGLKPTFELVPMIGHAPAGYEQPYSSYIDLAVAGPLARSASDLKDILGIIAGPGKFDDKAYRWTPPAPRFKKISEFRIGYVLEDPLCPVSSEIAPLYENTIRALEKTGAKMVKGWPAGINTKVTYRNYLYLLSAFSSEDLSPQDKAMMTMIPKDAPAHALAEGALEPHSRWIAETRRRYAIRAAWEDAFRDIDVFLSPMSFTPAYPHDHKGSPTLRMIPTPEGKRPFLDSLFWIHPATLAGLPAVSAPVGQTQSGLPAGIQIMGPYLEDATAVEFASALAGVIGGFEPPKGYA